MADALSAEAILEIEQRAAARERERIVRWMRTGWPETDDRAVVVAAIARVIADAIEAGSYLD